MKSGKLITLTLAGISLALTGCRRATPFGPHGTEILPPGDLSQEMRSSLPAFAAEQSGALANPPLNAYDPHLGYFHSSCNAWFPYPYGHYDSRWGYYRCGKWYRSHKRPFYSSGTHTTTGRNQGLQPLSSPGTAATAASDDLDSSPTAGAPMHAGVPASNAEATRTNSTSRGGFGSTGRRSSFSSSS